MATVAVAVTGLALGLGGGAPRPEVEAGARRLIVERAERADERLAALESELAPAVEAARTGGARTVAGDEPPGPSLTEAARLTSVAAPAADAARRAVAELERARRAWMPGAAPLTPATEAGELASIAGQLEASAEAADEFAAMRSRAASVAASLEAAIVALDAGDVAAAGSLVADARAAHAAIASWDVDFVTLPVWLETTGEIIGAVERIVTATERGDAAAAEAAAAEFAALAEEGATADRALRIAMSEGGGAVAAVPLERLAAVLAAAGELRRAVDSVRDAAAP